MAARAHNLAWTPAADPVRPPLPVAKPFMPSAHALLPYLERIDTARWYSNFGPLLTAFESRLAERFEGAALATVANGTLGLTLTLKALRVQAGTLCLMPSWTFVATAHAAAMADLVPWFADVDAADMALQPSTAEALIQGSPGTVGAVIVTAPFGRMPDLDAWCAVQARTGVPVIIDAAAAFDGAWDARLPVMVSLHATKALGVGEGGLIVSEDAALIEGVRELSSFGFHGSREARRRATNAKLSEYAAAVGLAALDAWPTTRLRYALTAQRLRMALARTPDVVFQPGWGDRWVSSTCVVHLPEGAADRVETRLATAGIDTRRWWSRGCHASTAFADCPYTSLPHTDRLATSTLGLPYWADMEIEEIERLADALSRAIAEG